MARDDDSYASPAVALYKNSSSSPTPRRNRSHPDDDDPRRARASILSRTSCRTPPTELTLLPQPDTFVAPSRSPPQRQPLKKKFFGKWQLCSSVLLGVDVIGGHGAPLLWVAGVGVREIAPPKKKIWRARVHYAATSRALCGSSRA
jgi:hypothetical protein